MRRQSLISIILLLCIAAPMVAQDTAPYIGWPIEQHCVGDPTPPPDDWTYDGTIFVQGTQGIRALNDYYQTPYFALFESPFIYAASLSPNGQWYAVPAGYRGYATMIDYAYLVDSIMIVSTDTRREAHYVPWRLYSRGSFDMYSVLSPLWLDNEHILYARGSLSGLFDTYVINPFTAESSQWEGEISPLNAAVSSDGTLAVQGQLDYATYKTSWNLLNYPDGEVIIALPALSSLLWSPDSTIFAATVELSDDDSNKDQLTLFDRAGTVTSVIFLTEVNQSVRLLAFSHDGQLLTFVLGKNFYVADIQNQKVIETCLTLAGHRVGLNAIAWSPHFNQLAFRYQDVISVLNIESNEFYNVSSVPGEVVAWGAAD
jgi:WD40 repeat protein